MTLILYDRLVLLLVTILVKYHFSSFFYTDSAVLQHGGLSCVYELYACRINRLQGFSVYLAYQTLKAKSQKKGVSNFSSPN